MDKGYANINSYKQNKSINPGVSNDQVKLKNSENSTIKKKEDNREGQNEVKNEKKHPFSDPKHSPLKIPKNVKIKKQSKNGYEQIKYIWHRGKFKYESRWHTSTPGSPNSQQSWVVTRTTKGIGFGKDSIGKKIEVLVGKKWVSWSKWNAAINARKNKTATKEQIDMLNKGHFTKRGK
ncbi:MAG: hypothetical protein MJZ76_10310 [Bacteroidales bacterium]|nr:hypothetical protein [Bacteroidales bacterium]